MVWTVRWRGAEGLPTRAAFSIFLSIFFYALVPFGFILAAPEQNGRRLAAVCVYRHGQQFSRFAALAAKHQIDNPVMRINRFIIWAG